MLLIIDLYADQLTVIVKRLKIFVLTRSWWLWWWIWSRKWDAMVKIMKNFSYGWIILNWCFWHFLVLLNKSRWLVGLFINLWRNYILGFFNMKRINNFGYFGLKYAFNTQWYRRDRPGRGSSLYCPLRDSGQMTIGETHPTLFWRKYLSFSLHWFWFFWVFFFFFI